MAEPQIAPAPRRARGRPRGTGIDDATLIVRIADLLRSDEQLKPTTAIKRLGITDPSVIRRLRDKLRGRETVAPSTSTTETPPERPRRVAAALPAAMATTPPATATAPPAQPSTPTADAKFPQVPESEQEKRTRNALLLAAYLEALAKTASPSTAAQTPPRAPEPPTPIEPPPPQSPPAEARAPEPPEPPFRFPGMPPFLQPFRQSPIAPAPGASPNSQLEGMKLAVEAMTSMTRLQLHITQNAMTYSPMALMLQGQAFVGQMLLASFTGQLDAAKRKPKEEK